MRALLITLLVFLGIGAIAGGGLLILAPDGALLGMPLSVLEKSPFTNFRVPGIILFLVLGLFPLIVAIGLLKKKHAALAEKLNLLPDMHWSWTFSLYAAFADILWIQFQMQLIQSVSWLHTSYVFLGLAILITALMPQVRNFYRKNAP
ncbi:MAG: hypothetical protein HYZ14_15125 [Bacteroidetes bacterium]|nr:hypothetical protein [Bacteroidota bacterium]